jgi:HNH/Endo VII superfamily nuclease toxins
MLAIIISFLIENQGYAFGLLAFLCLGIVYKRSAAFRKAKRDAKIAVSQQPTHTNKVEMTDKFGKKILNEEGLPLMTKEYHYTNQNGEKIVIQDHSAGHEFEDGGTEKPHFNVRPEGDTRNGKVEGTDDHYEFEK